MERCDALVVGGGPAGSTCAWKLKQAGLDVLVLDRASFPRDKVCAGWLTPAVVQELELDAQEYGQGRVFQAITGFRTRRLGGREVETRYPFPVSYGIRRCELDHFLLERSRARVECSSLAELRREGDQWVVNEEIRTPLVIGAGGHFCPVARRLGARTSGEAVVAAQEIEFVMDARQERECRIEPDTPELYFCRDLLGYGWCFRKESCLNVGFGRQGSRHFSAHVRDFEAFLAAEGRVPRDAPSRWRGHAYLVYPSAGRPLLDDGVLLVGDSAGLAYPESGEGIRPAVESGLLAARTVLAANGTYTREALASYRRAIESRFGPRDAASSVLGLPASLRSAAGAAVLDTPWLTRRLVVDRWFLHRHQPLLPSEDRRPAHALPPRATAIGR